MHPTPRVYFACFLSVLLLAACNGSSGSGSAGISSSGTGYVRVNLTDAPLDMSTVASVNVTIEGVIVYGAMLANGSEPPPMQLMSHPATFDLMTLTGGAQELLADGNLPAGLYDRIRLEIAAADLVFTSGDIETLKIESQKVDIPIPFEVGVSETLDLTLDFQADASVQVNHASSDKYILRPVVTPVWPAGGTPGS